MENTLYRTVEWLNKRKAIIERDNCTCQNCGTFDPSSGIVTVFNKKENDIELHEYKSGSSDYILTSHKYGITLIIEFGWGTWLVTPILQVHHKKYVKDLSISEYPDSDLVTLCKSCHTELHRRQKIEIYNQNNILIESKLLEPKDISYRKTHDFKPWIFVNKNGAEYSISNVYPHFTYLVMEGELDKIEEHRIVASEMIKSFFDRFLPDYKSEINLS